MKTTGQKMLWPHILRVSGQTDNNRFGKQHGNRQPVELHIIYLVMLFLELSLKEIIKVVNKGLCSKMFIPFLFTMAKIGKVLNVQ